MTRHETRSASSAYALEALGISKRFAGTQALTDAHLRLRAGTVHALLGGNGSGKSTMIKCLVGVHRADSGEIALGERCLSASSVTPSLAHRHGLRVVHQDLGLFDGLSIAENFALAGGFPTRPGGSIRWSALNRRVDELLEQYGLPIRATHPVGRLRPAQKTMVAIARALRDQRSSEHVLLLDEPTASLPEQESRELLAALRERATDGQTIAMVSHRLHEVVQAADEVTVFRDGRVAGTISAPVRDEDELVSLIAGPQLRIEAGRRDSRVVLGSERVRLANVGAGPLKGIDLAVRAGEIVGVAGLVGSGRTTLLNAVFGLVRPTSGTVTLDGRPLRPGSTRGAKRRGVALVPENRLRDAAFPGMSVRENLSAATLRRYWRGWIRHGEERSDSQQLLHTFAVKARDVETPFAQLSGGNQQKVVLARWLRREPRLLLLDEPTQGVDVVARSEIYRTIRKAAARGCGVLVASSDHEELALLADRAVVLAEGRVAANVAGSELTARRLTELAQTSSRTPVEEQL